MLSTSKQEGTKSFKPPWGDRGQEISVAHTMSCHQSPVSPEMSSPRMLVATTWKVSCYSQQCPPIYFDNNFRAEHDALQRAPLEREGNAGAEVQGVHYQPQESTAHSSGMAVSMMLWLGLIQMPSRTGMAELHAVSIPATICLLMCVGSRRWVYFPKTVAFFSLKYISSHSTCGNCRYINSPLARL